MAITTERNGKIEVIFPVNDLDSINGQEIKSHIHNILNDVDGILINFSKVNYLNSSGLRELIQTLKAVQEKEKKIALSRLSGNITKIFVNTNLHRLFTIYENDEEAFSQMVS